MGCSLHFCRPGSGGPDKTPDEDNCQRLLQGEVRHFALMNLALNFAGIKMKNPVMVASGTFGYGEELMSVFDVNRHGGGGRWLDAYWVSPDVRWNLDYELVFVLRK